MGEAQRKQSVLAGRGGRRTFVGETLNWSLKENWEGDLARVRNEHRNRKVHAVFRYGQLVTHNGMRWRLKGRH